MSGRSTSLNIPSLIDEAARDRVKFSFEGNFNGYIISLIRSDLAGVDARAEDFYRSVPMSGVQRDRIDEEIVRLFRERSKDAGSGEPSLPEFLRRPNRGTT